MAHGDFKAHEQRLLERYDYTKPYGVQNILRDIHDLREKRFAGTDTTLLSCILIDFERLIQKARLTQRQKEAIWYHYELDMPQSEVAELFGISQQGVSKHIDNAIRKIVVKAKQQERGQN